MKVIILILGAVLCLASAQQCSPGDFICPNGRCIKAEMVCDGRNDCWNWADETACENCAGFECKESRICLPERVICDGMEDCGDGSDEEADEACPCAEGEFRCGKPPGSNVPPGPCILPEQVCDDDGIWDCPDGSDEGNCTLTARRQQTY